MKDTKNTRTKGGQNAFPRVETTKGDDREGGRVEINEEMRERHNQGWTRNGVEGGTNEQKQNKREGTVGSNDVQGCDDSGGIRTPHHYAQQ